MFIVTSEPNLVECKLAEPAIPLQPRSLHSSYSVLLPKEGVEPRQKQEYSLSRCRSEILLLAERVQILDTVEEGREERDLGISNRFLNIKIFLALLTILVIALLIFVIYEKHA